MSRGSFSNSGGLPGYTCSLPGSRGNATSSAPCKATAWVLSQTLSCYCGQTTDTFPPILLVHKSLMKAKWDWDLVILTASAWVRQHWFATLSGLSVKGPTLASFVSVSDLPRPQSAASSKPQLLPSDGLEAPLLNPEEQVCSEQVRKILLGCRKPSTRMTYVAKWSSQHGVLPLHSSLQLILSTYYI